ncbi:MAG: sigma-70 family RNA polymerase sigma factor [Propionibacteriaceae bacterium]|nr:sigma-70 family RNA polymerase sigma factor [Propionibacteriaceae bacterium]
MERHDRDRMLAKRIEAGLLAQELLDSGQATPLAEPEELQALVDEGHAAKEELTVVHLGLVKVIAAETARYRPGVAFADLFQEGCVALQQAIMSYDWHKGPLGPYAGMWIRAAVRRITTRTWVSLDEVDVEDVSYTHHHERALNRDGVARVLRLIPLAQREILRYRTGWDGPPRSRHDIAGELGISVAKVRYLELAGLESLRKQWDLAEAA